MILDVFQARIYCISLPTDYINTTMLQDRYKGTLLEGNTIERMNQMPKSSQQALPDLIYFLSPNWSSTDFLFGSYFFFQNFRTIKLAGKDFLKIEFDIKGQYVSCNFELIKCKAFQND